MSPILRAPVPVTGAVEGLLCRGMPVIVTRQTEEFNEDMPCAGVRVPVGASAIVSETNGGWCIVTGTTCDPNGPTWSQLQVTDVAVDWSSPAALEPGIRWLIDRGHAAAWMRPLRYGGRVPAWDGLTEDEVAAILVSVSVREVAAWRGPVADFAMPDSLDWVARGIVEGGGAALVPGGVMVGVPDAP